MENIETKDIVVDYLRHRLREKKILVPESCLLLPNRPKIDIACAIWNLSTEFRTQFLDSFELMLGELKIVHDKNKSEAAFMTVAAELFSEGVKWSHIIALFVFSGELAVAYGERTWTDLLDPLSDWVTTYIDIHLLSWIREHGDWMGLVDYEKGRRPNDFEENPWPRLKNLVCGLAAGALGILTLKALLSKSS